VHCRAVLPKDVQQLVVFIDKFAKTTNQFFVIFLVMKKGLLWRLLPCFEQIFPLLGNTNWLWWKLPCCLSVRWAITVNCVYAGWNTQGVSHYWRSFCVTIQRTSTRHYASRNRGRTVNVCCSFVS